MNLGRRSRREDEGWEIEDIVQKMRVLSIHPKDYDESPLTSSFKRMSVTRRVEPEGIAEVKYRYKSYVLASNVNLKMPGVYTTSSAYDDIYKLARQSK